MVRRINLVDILQGRGVPTDGSPWLMDWRSFDIPNTIVEGITNAAPGLVAITLSRRGGPKMIDAAEKAANARGAVILWWDGPDDPADVLQLENAIEEIRSTWHPLCR